MTLEEKIALLLPKKKVCEGCGCSYSDEELKSCGSVSCCPDGDTWEHIYNTGIDQCATNLKQAFEEGKICFVPSEDDIRLKLCSFIGEYQATDCERNGTELKFGSDMSDIPRKYAKELLSLLTKCK